MNKVGDKKADANPGTPYVNRISEDPNSNAGMVINDMLESDTGTYSVIVYFMSGLPFQENEVISLSTKYG